jgi:peptide deformylase
LTVRPIVVVGVPVLRQKAKRVSQFDAYLQKLVQDMIETMHDAPGVGLAAPQIGVPLRVAVIEVDDKLTVLVNPEIVKASDEQEELDEGCLSVPGYWGRITRHRAVTVKARDQRGKEIRVKGEGLFGQALQHEIDHLDGVLYIDRLESMDLLRKVEPGRRRREREQESERAPEPVI